MDKSLAVLSEVTIFQKYSRYQDKLNRRETWDVILDRWTKMMISHLKCKTREIRDEKERENGKKIICNLKIVLYVGYIP
jgi:hypothetical protein